ncbi:MAG TPA: UPF0175 family protein [Solidesulfovibrio magneticus]|nr:UPF0175 family protein [Solidesulfovibrio magneticus]
MSVHIAFELPEDVFSTFRQTPDEFVREMRLTSAVKWYELGLVSQSKAAVVADVSRQEFLAALDRFGVSPFQETVEEVGEALDHG